MLVVGCCTTVLYIVLLSNIECIDVVNMYVPAADSPLCSGLAVCGMMVLPTKTDRDIEDDIKIVFTFTESRAEPNMGAPCNFNNQPAFYSLKKKRDFP